MPLATLVNPGRPILWNLPKDNTRHFTVTSAVLSWQGLAGAKTALTRGGAGRGKDLKNDESPRRSLMLPGINFHPTSYVG